MYFMQKLPLLKKTPSKNGAKKSCCNSRPFDGDCQKYTQIHQIMQKVTLFQKDPEKSHARRSEHALDFVQFFRWKIRSRKVHKIMYQDSGSQANSQLGEEHKVYIKCALKI